MYVVPPRYNHTYTVIPYTTLFRSRDNQQPIVRSITRRDGRGARRRARVGGDRAYRRHHRRPGAGAGGDRMTDTRTDWTREEIAELFDLPFDELMWEAPGIHRRHQIGRAHV